MSREWTDIKTLKLIARYRENEILWNFNHPDYKDRNKRVATTAATIKAMADEFGTHSYEIERKLKNLTSHYYREKRKYEELKEPGVGSTWFAFDALSFLRGKNKSTTKPEDGQNAQLSVPPARAKKRKFFRHEPAKKAPKQDPPSLPASAERDDAAIFGEYIASKIRRMNPITTSKVQHQIQNIIYQAEMDILSQVPSSTASPSYEMPSSVQSSDYVNQCKNEYGIAFEIKSEDP